MRVRVGLPTPAGLPVQMSTLDEYETQQETVIAELQKMWRCEYHSKGKDLYCYVDPSNGLCFGLSHQNFGYWANQVVRVSLSVLQLGLFTKLELHV